MSTLPVMYNDLEYKLEYNPVNNKYRFQRNCVGPQSYIEILEADYIYSNSNSIFVNTVSGNDISGTGTIELAYSTLTKAANSCSSTHPDVIVENTAFIAEDLSGINNAYFEGFYAATGQTPTYTVRTLGYTPTDLNTIYVSKTGLDANAGTYAAPKLTVDAADNAASGKNLMIQDSETYTVAARTIIANGWYAALGQNTKIQFNDVGSVLETITPTVFESGSAAYSCVRVLPNNNIVIAYQDGNNSNQGTFVIYDLNKNKIAGPTVFETGQTYWIDIGVLSDSNFVIAYMDYADSDPKFVIYNSAGTIVKAITTVEAGSSGRVQIGIFSDDSFIIVYDFTTQSKFKVYDSTGNVKNNATNYGDAGCVAGVVCILSDDSFVIAYSNSSSAGYYTIYNSDFSIKKLPTKFSDNIHYVDAHGIDVLSNDNFVIAYVDYNASGKGCFNIYNSSGTVVKSVTEFSANDNYYARVRVFPNNNIMFYYIDHTDSDSLKLKIYDSDGNIIKSTTVSFGAVSIAYEAPISCALFDDDEFVIIYNNVSNQGVFVFSSQIICKSLSVSSPIVLNGLTFDLENPLFAIRGFSSSAKITRKYCEIENAKSYLNTNNTFSTYSTSEIDSQNCLIHDNSRGDYSEENTGTYKYNAFYANDSGYALHIKGTAANTGDITVEHNTFFDNYSGLRLEDNQGTKETVKNNIFHSNDNYDILAETAMSITYSILTGAVSNVTLGTGAIKSNPLFVNEGANDPNDIDLRLKLRVLGDYSTSPAYQLSDDTAPDRDAGAYDIIPIGSITTWDSIVITKPITGIDVNYEPVGATITKMKSADINSAMDSLMEVYTIKHDAITNANFLKLLALFNCKKNQIRFYGDPYTHPNDYILCKLIYEKTKGFTKYWRLTRTGRQDVQISFGRAFE